MSWLPAVIEEVVVGAIPFIGGVIVFRSVPFVAYTLAARRFHF